MLLYEMPAAVFLSGRGALKCAEERLDGWGPHLLGRPATLHYSPPTLRQRQQLFLRLGEWCPWGELRLRYE